MQKLHGEILAAAIFVGFAMQMPVGVQGQGLPLNEQIQNDNSQVQGDRQNLRQDQQLYRQKESELGDYIEKTEDWLTQSQQQTAQEQAQLDALKAKVKSPSALSKLLSTPGSQMQVLSTMLAAQQQQQSEAERNISSARDTLERYRSAMAQDRYQLNCDMASVDHDRGMFRGEMDSNADEVRQVQQRRFWRNPNRIFTNWGQSAYDAGYYNLGNR